MTKCFVFYGERGRNRTFNLLIKSPNGKHPPLAPASISNNLQAWHDRSVRAHPHVSIALAVNVAVMRRGR